MARLKDVGFAERRENATNTRLALVKKMQERLASPDVEAKLAERHAIVEARNQRIAIKEEERRQEEARLAALRAEEEARLAAERAAEEARLEVIRQEEERLREEKRKEMAARATSRAAAALAELTSARSRDSRYPARKQARQAS